MCERRSTARRAQMRRAMNHRSRQASVAASAMAERPSLLTDASVTMRAVGADIERSGYSPMSGGF
ncbi:hypothetical protein WT56_18110 [Burkholderia pseudomultivorans]|uniref:Uncharacterized protein n=1 Tax=Burkholderia pseudomultivorans TaxID=1207504 RepID=A0A132EGU4_9BURK|nr:hypothetical protein WT56_18110 [Burkholderia pseudomultivorans]